MALLRETFPVGRLGCNCTVAVCSETGEALVVDPGDDADRIRTVLDRLGGHVTKVVHTHAHLDHVLAAHEIAQPTQADVLLHPGDQWLWDHVPHQAALFGWSVTPLPAPTGALADGRAVAFGRREAAVLHTPGHTAGSTCFLLGRDDGPSILLSGDTLFRESVGRTDLWGTSFDELAKSIRERLFTLPDETAVVPGHGPHTTIGHEREENPFVGRRGDLEG
ncbi:MAG: MBL fold metallo-hydrolase [Deltaproteobacteria bacterium]|nr:MBL fold metallo-hydrolase [Deltaproteobacteria bacterium]